jgi:hypothetical protein
MVTGLMTTAFIRKRDILSVDGEQRFKGVSAYNWLINSGAIYNMTSHRSNYIIFTRGSLFITVVNGETTMAEGYRNILVDLLVKNAKPESFLLKDV